MYSNSYPALSLKRKQVKFKAKLRDLRKKTRTSLALEIAEDHVHDFGTSTLIEGDEFEHKCNTCDLVVRYEEMWPNS